MMDFCLLIGETQDPRKAFDYIVSGIRGIRHTNQREEINLLIHRRLLDHLFATVACCYLCESERKREDNSLRAKIVRYVARCLNVSIEIQKRQEPVPTIPSGRIVSILNRMKEKQSIIVDGAWYPVEAYG